MRRSPVLRMAVSVMLLYAACSGDRTADSEKEALDAWAEAFCSVLLEDAAARLASDRSVESNIALFREAADRLSEIDAPAIAAEFHRAFLGEYRSVVDLGARLRARADAGEGPDTLLAEYNALFDSEPASSALLTSLPEVDHALGSQPACQAAAELS